MKKRRRPQKLQNHESKSYQPPKPCPEPPLSLVKLLQEDSSVMDYFTLLQANVKYDIQKWKERSLKAERLAEETNGRKVCIGNKRKDSVLENDRNLKGSLNKRLSNSVNSKKSNDLKNKAKSKSERYFLMKNNQKILIKEREQKLEDVQNMFENKIIQTKNSKFSEKKNKGESNSGDLIALAFEDILDNISSCESNDNVSVCQMSYTDNISFQKKYLLRNDKFEKLYFSNQSKMKYKKREEVLKLLTEAYNSLKRLGVWVVDIHNNVSFNSKPEENGKNIENSNNCLDPTKLGQEFLNLYHYSYHHTFNKLSTNKNYADSPNQNITTTKIERRTDKDVMTDLMQALRSLIRAPFSIIKRVEDSSFLMNNFLPFLFCNKSQSIQPCFYKCVYMGNKDIYSTQREDYILLNKYGNIKEEKKNVYMDKCVQIRQHLETNAINLPKHPAGEGLILAFRALTIMDTYCSSLFTDEEWDGLFYVKDNSNIMSLSNCWTEENRDKTKSYSFLDAMRIGLRGRNICAMVISSFHNEITRSLSIYDCCVRVNEKTSRREFYDKNNIEECTLSNQFFYPIENNAVDIDPVICTENMKNKTYKKKHKLFSTKSLLILNLLAERVLHARLLSLLYQFRNEIQEVAQLVIEYVISASPSPKIENYKRHPPMLSLCILETMLLNIDNVFSNTNLNTYVKNGLNTACVRSIKETSWFTLFIQKTKQIFPDIVHDTEKIRLFSEAMALNIHTTAKQWREGLKSPDNRVRDVSKVELDAYKRLLISEKKWLIDECKDFIVEQNHEVYAFKKSLDSSSILHIKSDILNSSFLDFLAETCISEHSKIKQFHMSKWYLVHLCLSMQLLFILKGDSELIMCVCNRVISCLFRRGNDIVNLECQFLPLLEMCCKTYAIIKDKIWKSFCWTSNTHVSMTTHLMRDHHIKSIIDRLISILEENLHSHDTSQLWRLLQSLLRCSNILSDGHYAYYIMQVGLLAKPKKLTEENVVEDNNTLFSNMERKVIKSSVLRTILEAAEYPIVRVINLRRRLDRWVHIISQAYNDKLMTVLAVSSMVNWPSSTQHESVSNMKNEYWGCHAYDGRGSQLEFEENVSRLLGEKNNLSRFVQTHWRPNSLKAFDKEARIDDGLVRTSPSEKACALSHISSWVGVERSLAIFDDYLRNSSKICNSSSILTEKHGVLASFKISGFASGRSLLSENENMNPSPACIILEDDALLVNRFSDKLALLFDELPRDFHFCSLGYSRPKTAPMIKYSTHVGIPTCLWYLTGYILSLHGARFLLDHLPVEGPVDSWIGMKAAANWENEYGQKLGVGLTSKSRVDAEKYLPRRNDIGKIIKFRSFAALTPLCSQKIGRSTSLFLSNRNKWRERDTDITYSGCM